MRIAKIPSESVLFVHIETVPVVAHFEELSETMRRIFRNKIAHIKEEERRVEEYFMERAAIWAEFSRVLCISCGYIQGTDAFRVKSFYGDNESALLAEFIDLLNKHYNPSEHFLCAHNAKEFYFPFLCRRMLINNLQISDVLDLQGKKPWESTYLDTMDLWRFGDCRYFTSLELLAEVFHIPNNRGVKENEVYHMYYEKRKQWNNIVQRCEESVQIVAQLFRKYRRENLLSKVITGKNSSFI
ncbi:3'-5' exonuclease [Bacteroidetes bacterium endosymbiont of Geopemphigus sp.]|uniref:3'-5' exonuclease n=1 Tax=Bacteroidetes bacterium endosymbiont of Geopemphigus sp. TaxID=2047937 RepID=UPI000CD29910|nr:3'-5' exonuclease [Bacteroidetes bacterium endosymbiont of Geopemphigus sp.]